MLTSPEFKKAFYKGSIQEQMKEFTKGIEWLPKNYNICWELVKSYKPTVILATLTTVHECLAYGQKLAIPVIMASTIPYYPTSAFPVVTATSSPLPFGFLNSLTYKVVNSLSWVVISDLVNKFRTSIGLPVQSSAIYEATPHLCCFSELVVPRASDWPAKKVYETGYWILPPKSEFTPSKELSDFLGNGIAPVYLGLGSMPLWDSKELLLIFSKVLSKLGLRGIFATSWENPDKLIEVAEPHVLVIKGAPHEWLFPRCAAAIHHGGAGTTAACLRAGIPTIIFPVLADQPYWANRIGQLGVGPLKFYSIKELNENTLFIQIKTILSPEIIEKAKKLGELLKKENGTEKAVQVIENYMVENQNKSGILLEWAKDNEINTCLECKSVFNFFTRKHHCRSCGNIFCATCLHTTYFIPNYEYAQLVCNSCIKARELIKTSK